jgi:hypothetical protein
MSSCTSFCRSTLTARYPDYLVGANAGIRWNVASPMRNSHIRRIVAYRVVRSFHRRYDRLQQ